MEEFENELSSDSGSSMRSSVPAARLLSFVIRLGRCEEGSLGIVPDYFSATANA